MAAKIVHKEESEHYVLAAVLVPDVVDSQGHTYSKETVWKACRWFAENSRQFSVGHVLQGGKPCDSEQIVMIENFVQRGDVRIGQEDIPDGTWMLGSVVKDEEIWSDIIMGRLNAWSIGAYATMLEA
jgi:hypothetical protein